jgi:hypothetical protein
VKLAGELRERRVELFLQSCNAPLVRSGIRSRRADGSAGADERAERGLAAPDVRLLGLCLGEAIGVEEKGVARTQAHRGRAWARNAAVCEPIVSSFFCRAD